MFQTLSIEMKAHAGRIWTPSGTMPSCARRQSAINSLRARARSASCATGGLEIAVADMTLRLGGAVASPTCRKPQQQLRSLMW